MTFCISRVHCGVPVFECLSILNHLVWMDCCRSNSAAIDGAEFFGIATRGPPIHLFHCFLVQGCAAEHQRYANATGTRTNAPAIARVGWMELPIFLDGLAVDTFLKESNVHHGDVLRYAPKDYICSRPCHLISCNRLQEAQRRGRSTSNSLMWKLLPMKLIPKRFEEI